jgi:hypothetical protein
MMLIWNDGRGSIGRFKFVFLCSDEAMPVLKIIIALKGRETTKTFAYWIMIRYTPKWLP